MKCIAILPDEKIVTQNSASNTLQIWNSQGQLLNTLRGHTKLIQCVAIVPNGYIVTGSYKCIYIWDVDKIIKIIKIIQDVCLVNHILILPDGRIVTNSHNDLKIWSYEHKDQILLQGHTQSITRIVLWKGKIVSGSNDCSLKIWDPQEGTLSNTLIGHTNSVFDSVLFPMDE